jgi:hypothetical protein
MPAQVLVGTKFHKILITLTIYRGIPESANEFSLNRIAYCAINPILCVQLRQVAAIVAESKIRFYFC